VEKICSTNSLNQKDDIQKENLLPPKASIDFEDDDEAEADELVRIILPGTFYFLKYI